MTRSLKINGPPAVSAGLNQPATFQKPAKLDRREAQLFRKRCDLRRTGFVITPQEHDSPAAMYRRILLTAAGKWLKPFTSLLPLKACATAWDEGCPPNCSGHPVGIGDIHDRLPLPGGQRLGDLRVRLETDGQKDDVRLDGIRQCLGDDRRSDRGRLRREASRIARGGHGHFNTLAGMVLEQGGLSGNYNPENPLPKGSNRAETYNGMLPKLQALTDKLASIGQKPGAAAPDVATAWAIAKGTTPIIGITKPHHVDGLIRASSITLTSDDIAELEALADTAGVNTRGWWEREMLV